MAQRAFTNLVLLVLAIGLIASAAEAQTTLYVDTGGDGNGQGWHAPFKDLEDALATARGNPTITEIHVAGGVYLPSVESESGVPRSKTFQLVNSVAILGGYAGLADPGDPDARDLELYESVLSGDLSGDDTSVACTEDSPDCDAYGGLCVDDFCIIKANNAENAYHVVIGSDTDVTAMLDGFIITGGNANGSNPNNVGGGIYNYNSSPTVISCVFSGNTAVNDGGGMCNTFGSNPTVANCTFSGNSASYAGGMYNYFSSSPVVTNCTFSGNTAVNTGGGMFNKDSSSPTVARCTFTGNSVTTGTGGGGMHNYDSSPTVISCVFNGNTAVNDGGGMSNNFTSSPVVTDCTFSGNSASYAGGMYNYSSSSPVVTNCTFSGNTAVNTGGGMFNKDSSSSTVTNCTFNGNAAGAEGGAMMCDNSSPVIEGCRFTSNTSSSAGGAMANENNSTPAVHSSYFTGNSSGSSGGAVFSRNSDPRFDNCVFVGNSTNHNGGALYQYSNVLRVVNCTVVGNTTNINGAGLHLNINGTAIIDNCIFWGNVDATGMSQTAQIFSNSGVLTVNFSDVQGGWCGSGGHNIPTHPRFVRFPDDGGDGWGVGDNDDYGDMRLRSASPAIDAGNNAAVLPGTVLDVAGNPRFVDIADTPDMGQGDSPLVDMGAYEFQFAAAGDLDGDGDVDLSDFRKFLEDFGGPVQ